MLKMDIIRFIEVNLMDHILLVVLELVNKNGIDSTYNYSEFNFEGKEYVLTGELDYSIKDYVVYQIELE